MSQINTYISTTPDSSMVLLMLYPSAAILSTMELVFLSSYLVLRTGSLLFPCAVFAVIIRQVECGGPILNLSDKGGL